MSDTLPMKSDSLSMETPSMEIPTMEAPSIINIPHIDPLPERTEEEKAEAHRMFHGLLKQPIILEESVLQEKILTHEHTIKNLTEHVVKLTEVVNKLSTSTIPR